MRRAVLMGLACSSLAACSGKNAIVTNLLAEMSLPTAIAASSAATNGELPELVKTKPVEQVEEKPRWAPDGPKWVYPLPFDYGIRKDTGGIGLFLAPRAHGKHNGVDFLAPVGTPLTAICSGKAKSATRGGYGRVVQLVCKLPSDLGGDEGLYASFFYAHLSKTSIPEHYETVSAGSKLGAVGKTGNAAGPSITPHLHLEVIVRGSEAEALEEHHKGLEPRAKKAVDLFFKHLDDACIEPSGLKSGDAIRRERRVDPYVLLMCAAKPKPKLETPDDEALKDAMVKWSSHYSATGFDVDEGPQGD